MERMCPCGKQVLPNRRLCQECGDIYGFNSAEWPEWLRFLVSDTQRQLDFDLKHNHLRLDDIEPNGSGGYRAKREFALRAERLNELNKSHHNKNQRHTIYNLIKRHSKPP